MATTFRSDVAGAVLTLLTTFQTANPSLLRHIHRARPANVSETPSAWIGEIAENIVQTSGVRRRSFVVPVVIVDVLVDSSETGGRMDDLVDLLIDAFTAAPHAVSGTTLIEPTGVSEVEIEGPFRGVQINVSGLIQEGRS